MERKSLEEVEECLVPSRLLCCAQYRSLAIYPQHRVVLAHQYVIRLDVGVHYS